MGNSPEFQWEKLTIPAIFSDKKWEDIENISPNTLKKARTFIDEFPYNKQEGLYLHSGMSGTGKTLLSICILRELIFSGKTKDISLFLSFAYLMDDFRETIMQGISVVNSPVFAKIKKAHVIILDDIGVEKMNASVARRFYILVDYLWGEKKKVICTSKFNIQRLIERAEPDVEPELLESIASRIKGMCDIIVFDDLVDHRLV